MRYLIKIKVFLIMLLPDFVNELLFNLEGNIYGDQTERRASSRAIKFQ